MSEPAYTDGVARVYLGDAREVLRDLPDESVQCCVTSPPYWGLRDYGLGDRGIGLEPTVEEWVAKLVEVFREVRRVLRPDGTLWLNVGDSYAADRTYQVRDNKHIDVGNTRASRVPGGLKPKDLIGMPWKLAFALQADGWYLRSDIIWAKPNPMPESVTDRPTSAHEHIFLLSRRDRYYYNPNALREWSHVGDHPRNIREPLPSLVPGATAHSGIRHQIPRSQTFARDGAVADHILPGQSAAQHRRDHKPPAGWDFEAHGREGMGRFKQDGHGRRHEGFNGRYFDANWRPVELDFTRNSRNVWTFATQPYREAHFATFPEELARRCIAAGTRERGMVLDPFAGSGTTLAVAKRLNRDGIGIELNPDYLPLIVRRLEGEIAQPCLPLQVEWYGEA